MRCRAWWLGLVLASGCATTLERARTAKSRGDADEAKALYRSATSDPEQAAQARQELASLHVEEARAVEKTDAAAAEALYRDALDVAPAHDHALTGLVRLLRRAGRVDDASAAIEAAEAAGDCPACHRLEVVVLLERGDRAMASKAWDTAIARYGEALAMRRQPEPALAIARAHLLAGRREGAAEALGNALPLMTTADESATRDFFDTRAALVDAALAAEEIALADRARQIQLADEPGNPAVALELKIAVRVSDKGSREDAMARYDAILERHASAAVLTEAQASDVSARLADLHAARATEHLAAGKADAAEADLDRALELRPDDWEVKLQRVLVVATRSGAPAALEALTKLPPGTPGIPQVQAILESQHAIELVAAGRLDEARESLARGEKIHPDMPEVHLASAQLLSFTAPDDLGKKDLRALSKGGVVDYGGEVFRYAEALGELDWARAAVKGRAADYPFQAPWFSAAATALEDRVRKAYPFAVEFSPDPEPHLQLHNERDTAIEVELDGPGGYRDAIEIDPGHKHGVTLPESGVLRLRVDGKRRTYYAEPYATVTLDL
jgi:tetratricopeptide (TPR) repeat protein